MGESQIKGTAIIARLSFLDGQPGGRSEVMSRLSPDDRQALSEVLPIGLYPLGLKARLDTTIAATYRPDDPKAMFHELGRWAAKKNFELYHSTFLIAGNPHATMANAPALRRVFQTDGVGSYVRTGDNSGTFLVTGATDVDPEDCLSTAGYWEYALELSGAKRARVTHTQCIASGATMCEFQCRWE